MPVNRSIVRFVRFSGNWWISGN